MFLKNVVNISRIYWGFYQQHLVPSKKYDVGGDNSMNKGDTYHTCPASLPYGRVPSPDKLSSLTW